MALEMVRGPTPTMKYQPAEETTFIWCPRLPQFLGSRQSRLPEEKG
jgi:hypothetical protein